MKFTIHRDPLLKALQRSHSIVEKKSTVQILANILCTVTDHELSLYATDLEVGIKNTLFVENAEKGKATISAKHFLEIVKELPAQKVDLVKKENNWIELVCGKSKFSIMSLPAEEYPTLPSFEERQYLEANTEILKEMIDCTSFAVSTDTTRYNMIGVFFEHLGNNLMRMTACDGTRLSYIDHEVFLKMPDLKRGVIIPKKGLSEFRKLLDEAGTAVSFTFEKGYIFSKLGNDSLFIRLIDGEFPDYRQVIPKSTNQIVRITHADFLSALRRVSLLANEKSRAVKLSIQRNNLTISSSNPDMGEAREDIDVQYNGEPLEIGFNSKYLLDYLDVMKTEFLEIHLKEKMSPGILRGIGKSNHTYVIMPMRI